LNSLARAMLLASILVLGGLSSSAQKDSSQLTDFKCNISIQDQHSVRVSALITVVGDTSSLPTKVAVIRYPTQEIIGLSVMDDQRNAIAPQSAVRDGAMIIRIQRANSQNRIDSAFAFIVEYKVEDASGTIVRIPLPVPDARTPFGDTHVQIAVALPQGQVSVGDAFPGLSWQDSAHGSATLANVPSLAMIHWKPAHSIALADTITTPGFLADAGMMTLLVAGSLLWWLRSGRKTERRSSTG
jgi:hypothetical protein